MNFETAIIRFARESIGFDDCRFTSPFLTTELDEYRQLINTETFGDMAYLKRHLPFKENPNALLPGVKSAIVVIKNYYNSPFRYNPTPYKIARFAVGQDYNYIFQHKLEKLEKFISYLDPSIHCYSSAGSRPIAERSLALKAGIGFRGKNKLVIKPGLGSFFNIGVILTTMELTSDLPLTQNCGDCRLCIDACPTHALSETGLDIPRCISYQTIERKPHIRPNEQTDLAGWIFGCDICQEVCPYNAAVTITDWTEYHPESGVGFEFGTPLINHPDAVQTIPKTSPLYRVFRKSNAFDTAYQRHKNKIQKQAN